MSKKNLTTFGDTIKELRLNKKLQQRKVAAFLDIDTSLLAKYEKNIRQPSREMILKIAELFNVDGEKLISEALTDKIATQILEENADRKLIRKVEEKVEYLRSKK